jgi:hypothetical protein
MSDKSINESACVKLAERFIRAARLAIKDYESGKATPGINGTKHTAAMKRASMDLTRGLADLRHQDEWIDGKRVARDARRWL